MPLYSDSNYYYSGGSSQLYSPYYPTSTYSSSGSPSASSSYAPYSSTFNRTFGGSYVVPLAPPRTPTYGTHGLSSSRYQPKLSTITETSTLMPTSRHTSMMPLTRLQSPKYTSYSKAGSSAIASKYIPPRPININTADIDVSSSRYHRHREEGPAAAVSKSTKSSTSPSPNSSIKRKDEKQKEEKKAEQQSSTQAPNQQLYTAEGSEDRPTVRSTIKRDRAVVRLSTIRSRSKGRSPSSSGGRVDSSPEPPDKRQFHDLPPMPPIEDQPKLSWRQKLADDLAAIPTYPAKKSPGELIRERYLIQDAKEQEQKNVATATVEVDPSIIDEVVVELDPVDHSIRRLSIPQLPQCPTFHDICEDISSDKIDDDLNAGALRRRASLIQEQEQEILNQLQKSTSGTFQLIHLERQESQDNLAEEVDSQIRKSLKRKSKKGKNVRHKITAIVDIENAPIALATIPQEKDEEGLCSTRASKDLSPKPKFTFNVDSVEEHHEIHQIFKLPKSKKSLKKETETVAEKKKVEALPEGFISKEAIKPKPKTPKSGDKDKTKVLRKSKSLNVEEVKKTLDNKTVSKQVLSKSKSLQDSQKEEEVAIEKSTSTLQMDDNIQKVTDTESKLQENKANTPLEGEVKKEEVKKEEVKKEEVKKEEVKKEEVKMEEVKKEEAKKEELKKEEARPKLSKISEKVTEKAPTTPITPKSAGAKAENKFFDNTKKLETSKLISPLEKPASYTLTTQMQEKAEEVQPSVAKPKPIIKSIQKSDSGEDFWSQIGSRETLYMTNRKKTVLECQWQKREDLLEAQNNEQVKNLSEIKSAVTTQREEALKKADADVESTNKTIAARSQSTESKLAKKSPKEAKAKAVDEPKTENKISPLKKKKTTPVKVKSPKKTVAVTTATTAIAKAKETNTTTAVTTTTATTTLPKVPKINAGQTAKSPEQFALAPPLAQTEVAATTTATVTTAADSTNKEKLALSVSLTVATTTSTATIATNKTQTKPNTTEITNKLSTPTIATTTTTNATATTAVAKLQPEIKIDKPAEANTKTLSTTATTSAAKSVPDDKTKILTAAKIKSEASNKAKTSPTIINADQFFAPAKVAVTSPNKNKNASSAAATAKAPTKPTSVAAPAAAIKNKENTKTTTTNAATTATPVAPAAIAIATTTTTPTAATTAAKALPTIATTTTTTTATAIETAAATAVNAVGDSHLAKFATVANLTQCLQNVDADLSDYIPSSAESSDDNFSDEDSANYRSSIDGSLAHLTASMKKKVRRQRRRKEKVAAAAEQPRFDPQKKVKIDPSNKCFAKEEAPRYPLVATPRPLWKREKIVYPAADSDESDSDESGSTEETEEESEECSSEFEDELRGTGATTNTSGSEASKENSAIIRMSTCSNDSGFEGGTAPSSPKKMLECDVNCHKKCERLTANLCGVNQKLIVEALAYVKRGTHDTRDSPSTPPSQNPAYKIDPNEEEDDETSYTYSQFQKSGRFTAPATVIPRFKNYTVDDFHFLAVLGKGSFGKVLLAELRDTTYYYAVKCLKKDVVLEDDDVDSTLIERKVLALGTKHPYLCHLFCTFQTESHLFFVMEYLNGGDLMFHIQESGRFSEERARFYGAEIISGLKFLHKKGIIYRDLKLDNVLLDFEGHVRIADFGMCKLQIYLDKTADSFCGTPDYMAPEIIKGEKYNQNVDWWSFGVLLYEMLIGQSPFSGCDEDELFWSICNEIPWFPVYITKEATSILKGLLEKDYTKRIGSQYSPAGDIGDHMFFRPIDWNLLEKRLLEPPFKPQVKHPLDTQYFDRVFTKERVRLTPIDKEILQSMDQKQFLGFTYTNPHITLD